MESAGRRHRKAATATPTPAAAADVDMEQPIHPSLRGNGSKGSKRQRGSLIPRFTIDLSQPPEHRYDHVAPRVMSRVDAADLPKLFDELVGALAGTAALGRLLVRAAALLLRRVYDATETAELRGIAACSGIALHVLVAFNVLLDVLLGCTSCGLRVLESDMDADGGSAEGQQQQQWPKSSRMLHFRTLDWGMDELRKLAVELDYVAAPGGPVVATVVTYFGFVGVLTGVRKGLSMSLNFRPRHDGSTWRKRLGFRWHQTMVVLGFRPAISSVLRSILFEHVADIDAAPAEPTGGHDHLDASRTEEQDHMAATLSKLSTSRSTAAYLIFCTPQKVYVVEKDHKSARIRESDTYLTAYNHDGSDEADPAQLAQAAAELAAADAPIGMEDLVKYSLDRKTHLDKLWRRREDRCTARYQRTDHAVRLEDALYFVRDKEISNDETHYAVLMDPYRGKILWRRLYDTE